MPPPITGQTMAFQLICDGFQERKLPFRTINLSGTDHTRAEGGFSFRRLAQLLKPFCKASYLFFSGRRNLYLSATQNWIGFCRDSVFILLAKVSRGRVVIHIHGGNYDGFYSSLSPLQRYVVRYVIRKVDRILILGESLRRMFDFEPGVRHKIRVVFNGLPYGAGATAVEPKRLPMHTEGRPKLLYLSNLIVSKGYLHVLEAVHKLVNDSGIDVECHFCGSFVLASDMCPYPTPEKAESDFLNRIESLGLTGHVFWHGPVSGDQKLSFLTDCHFFLLPTNYYFEGQPISIIEALAFGLVVITSPHRTIPDMIAGGEAGELVPFGHPENIAVVIESYLQEPLKYEAMSRASIDRYHDEFTREVHLDRLISCILS